MADPARDDPQQRPRYTGIPTFFRLPHQPVADGLDVAVVGVPFDGGVTNRPGARHGPREVRNQSSLIRRINQATGVAPFDRLRVADLGDAWVERPYSLESAHQEIEAAFMPIHRAGVRPLSIGGDHSVTLPILRAIARDGPLGLVHVDAHCDTGGEYLGSRYHHGTPFSRAVEEGLLDPKRAIQIGIRGTVNDPDIWRFSHDSGMRVVSIEEVAERGIAAIGDEARSLMGDGPVYLSFDIDALDPAFAPGTGTPEVGGMTSLEATLLLRRLAGLRIAAADLVEVAPPFDPSGVTALTGAHLAFEILCLMADGPGE